ncbi:beta-ketoacyl synthase chain length factor [Aerolutibacter ruishenii]|uniref:Beta-ketoacyl synthase-like protein n=1 Tax=Aerolutibacter ruishenii TaxID=686800 RepID=A0A562M0B8_9GAMM|nr:beta-ketoacyl synthase chain length factor [Lysobacter ruishenii]TWI13320.1 beta-ketoacyl synthase-like protein [Lysobacter ruishenii]
MIEFTVADWAAWAPGLHERETWQAWSKAPVVPSGDDTPALAEVPAMQRRRIDRLGRMAVQVAWWCSQAEAAGVPLVFASRHGDVQRSFVLLEQMTRGEPMSPTQFGLSVHNAIAALYSIVRGERGNYLALAAGQATAEAALVEAAGLLADGAPEVLVVVYDASMPEAYAGFVDEPDPFHAWSWRVRADGEGTRLALGWTEDVDHVGGPGTPESAGVGEDERASGTSPHAIAGVPTATGQPATAGAALPAGLEVLRFLLAGEPMHVHRADGLCWRWRRHG